MARQEQGGTMQKKVENRPDPRGVQAQENNSNHR